MDNFQKENQEFQVPVDFKAYNSNRYIEKFKYENQLFNASWSTSLKAHDETLIANKILDFAKKQQYKKKVTENFTILGPDIGSVIFSYVEDLYQVDRIVFFETKVDLVQKMEIIAKNYNSNFLKSLFTQRIIHQNTNLMKSGLLFEALDLKWNSEKDESSSCVRRAKNKMLCFFNLIMRRISIKSEILDMSIEKIAWVRKMDIMRRTIKIYQIDKSKQELTESFDKFMSYIHLMITREIGHLKRFYCGAEILLSIMQKNGKGGYLDIELLFREFENLERKVLSFSTINDLGIDLKRIESL